MIRYIYIYISGETAIEEIYRIMLDLNILLFILSRI